MKIRKVRFDNFRQFYGEQELEFAAGDERNVTLVHAENGFGKTTILNAVLWAFFNQLTKKFERPDQIVNFQSLDEGNNGASVDVEFEFEANTYLVRRRFDGKTDKRDKTDFTAYKIQNGALKPLPTPETFIASVVPPEMAKYFFFDGESAEAFSSATNFQAIGAAIRSILGCSLADTAISDLKEITKQIDREMGNVPGDAELTRIEKQLSGITEQHEVADSLKSQLEESIATLIAQRDEILNQLRTIEGAKQIQERRDEKQRDLDQLEADIKATRQEIVRWVGHRAIQVVSRKLAQETLNFIDEASLRGRIPSPYNEEFVKGLLKEEICICHRDIKPGTKEWRAVAELLKNASNAETMGRVVRARGRVNQLREEAADAPKALEAVQSRLGKLIDVRRRLEQEVAELGQKIENLPLAEIAERERARQKLDQKIQRKNQELGGAKAEITRLGMQRHQLEQELEKAARKNKLAQKLLNRRQLVVRSGELLTGLLSQYEEQARKTIQGDINEILKAVAHRDYQCRLNPNFSIELTFSDGRPTPKSGGENQLLSLVFIASLVKYAASRIDNDELILKPGTVAPLVLDAPFGQLDTNYQEETARNIPKLAEQVVLLVSSSQGNKRVLKALEPYIGAEYALISENKEMRGSKKETSLDLYGKKYVTSIFNRPRSMTRIERIK